MSSNKIRISMSIDKDVWEETKAVASKLKMSASAYASYVICQQNLVMTQAVEKILNMKPEELAVFVSTVEKIGGKNG